MADRDLCWLDTHDPELERVWNLLEGGPDALNETFREVWHYMGTWRAYDGRGWIHEFRHRAHPSDNKRRYVRHRAPDGWEPPAETMIVMTAPAA